MVRPVATTGFSLLIALLIGCVSGSTVSLFIGIGCLLVLCGCMFVPSFRRGSKAFAVILAALFVGSMMFCLIGKLYIEPVQSLAGKTLDAVATVVDIPDSEGDSRYFTLDVELNDKEVTDKSFRVSSADPKLYNCVIFDKIDCSLSFELLESSNRLGNLSRRCFVSCTVIEIYDITKGNPSFFSKAVYDLRNHFISSVENNIGSDPAGIVEAISLGNKSNISMPVQNDFRLSGVSHLVAVSGLHVSMIAAMLTGLFFSLRIKKKWAAVFSTLSIWFFVITIGAPLSAVRAATMYTVYCISSAIYNRMDQVNALSVAVLAVCIVSPFAAADIGFLCSVSATLGILVFHPVIQRIANRKLPSKLSGSKFFGFLFDTFSPTSSQTVFTLPCSVLFFHRISIIALVFNIIAIPLATEALFFSLIGNILSFSTALSAPFITVGGFFAKIIAVLAKFFAKIPFASLSTENRWVMIWFVGFVVLAGAGIIIYLLAGKKKIILKTVAILCAVGIVFCSVGAAVSKKVQTSIYVSSGENTMAVLIKSGSESSIVYLSDQDSAGAYTNLTSTAYTSGCCRLDNLVVGSGSNIYLPNIAKLCQRLDIKNVSFSLKDDLDNFGRFVNTESTGVYDDSSFLHKDITCEMADNSCLITANGYRILMCNAEKSSFTEYDAVICRQRYLDNFQPNDAKKIVPTTYEQIPDQYGKDVLFSVRGKAVVIDIYSDHTAQYTLK